MNRRTRLRRLVVGAGGAAAVAVAGGAGVPGAARGFAWTPMTRSRNLSLRSPRSPRNRRGPRSPRSPRIPRSQSRRRTLGRP